MASHANIVDLESSEEEGKTSASILYRRLRQDILNGTLAPGSRLIIDALRTRYTAGLSPIREALNRLSSEGLVQQQDLRGFQVTPIELQDFEELTRARCLIEGGALRESIRRGDSAWEEGVVVAHYRLTRAPQFLPGDPPTLNPDWEACHVALHRAMIAACGSRWLLLYCQQLSEFAGRYLNIAVRANLQRRVCDDEHRVMTEAVISRDEDRAVQLLVDHLSRTSLSVQQRLDLP